LELQFVITASSLPSFEVTADSTNSRLQCTLNQRKKERKSQVDFAKRNSAKVTLLPKAIWHTARHAQMLVVQLSH
jgi:hypothetical protein